jgi:hypothetical protein
VMVIMLFVAVLAGALATAASGALSQQRTSNRQVSDALTGQSAIEPAAAMLADREQCGIDASQSPLASPTRAPKVSPTPTSSPGFTMSARRGTFSSAKLTDAAVPSAGCQRTPPIQPDAIQRTTASGLCSEIDLGSATGDVALWTEVRATPVASMTPSAVIEVGTENPNHPCPSSFSQPCPGTIAAPLDGVLQIGFECQLGGELPGDQALWLVIDGATVLTRTSTIRYASVSDSGSSVASVIAPIPGTSDFEVADLGTGSTTSLLYERKLG